LGNRSITARATVSPPKPESKIPIGPLMSNLMLTSLRLGENRPNESSIPRTNYGKAMSSYRHIVLFNWKSETPAGHAERTIEALSQLRPKIPQIQSYEFGANLGINPGTYDFAVTATFNSVDDYIAYRDNPDHKAFIAEFTAPFVETRASIQFEI